LEILPGEVGLDGNRAHVDQGAVEPEYPVHQDGVFVDLLFVDLHEALSHWLDITNAPITTLEGAQQAERSGSLAVILARRRYKDARRNRV
jgi:hypothetical protein